MVHILRLIYRGRYIQIRVRPDYLNLVPLMPPDLCWVLLSISPFRDQVIVDIEVLSLLNNRLISHEVSLTAFGVSRVLVLLPGGRPRDPSNVLISILLISLSPWDLVLLLLLLILLLLSAFPSGCFDWLISSLLFLFFLDSFLFASHHLHELILILLPEDTCPLFSLWYQVIRSCQIVEPISLHIVLTLFYVYAIVPM